MQSPDRDPPDPVDGDIVLGSRRQTLNLLLTQVFLIALGAFLVWAWSTGHARKFVGPVRGKLGYLFLAAGGIGAPILTYRLLTKEHLVLGETCFQRVINGRVVAQVPYHNVARI